MKAAVIVSPGSNCDRDVQVALRQSAGSEPIMHWHGDTNLPDIDLIVLPGGFSYGDYLRAGALAAQSPVIREVVARANKGVPVLGICNGFQILTECGLLPGVLMRNAGQKFICRDVDLRVETADTVFTRDYVSGQIVRIPVAHNEGNYFADDDTLASLRDNGQIALKYVDGPAFGPSNPNGSAHDIAGIVSSNGRIMGMMPHPERCADPLWTNTDGQSIFQSLISQS